MDELVLLERSKKTIPITNYIPNTNNNNNMKPL